MLSHELRNPLGAVKNGLEVLKHRSLWDEEKRDEIEEVLRTQVEQISRLLDDLLDVARFGQNRIEFRQEVVDLTLLAEDFLQKFSHELNA